MRRAQALVALAQQELTLVLEGRDDELDALHEQREQLMSAPVPDVGARWSSADLAALQEAAGLQQLVTLALVDRTAAVRGELAGLHRGRAAAHGYGRTGA
ncbi:hypothetical protein [Paraconexibacter sp.]|uniref:hypothetical protein n=1 Tax=Paraconexibacter sp. TaxID=2949640 RepID=UPI003569D638